MLSLNPNLVILSQWYGLVEETVQKEGVSIEEDLENYLVLTLDHFTTDQELATVVIAIDFYQALEQLGYRGVQQLREVGDRCLLLAGFFPNRARRKRVSERYFISIGQQAYQTLAGIPTQKIYDHQLFYKLSNNFEQLAEILRAMRQLSNRPLH